MLQSDYVQWMFYCLQNPFVSDKYENSQQNFNIISTEIKYLYKKNNQTTVHTLYVTKLFDIDIYHAYIQCICNVKFIYKRDVCWYMGDNPVWTMFHVHYMLDTYIKNALCSTSTVNL